MYYSNLKSVLDFLFALILLFFSFPLFILVALLIKLEDPTGPIIFKQIRIGQNERRFTLYKFRSMKQALRKDGKKMSDNERLLKTGKLIRQTSLDELPQLMNILKGEMSFIGPRPLLEEYLPYYTEIEKMRHTIKPGISGWAQVNGRNRVTWEEKFAYDLHYVKEISIALDCKIILLTIQKVLGGSDVVEPGYEITESLVDNRMNQMRQSESLIEEELN